jgi:hypothetical protein
MIVYLILDLIQSSILELDFKTCLDHVVLLSNGLVSKLIGLVITEERDSSEGIILLSQLIQDILTLHLSHSIEFPVATLVLKSVILQLIQNIQLDQTTLKIEDPF